MESFVIRTPWFAVIIIFHIYIFVLFLLNCWRIFSPEIFFNKIVLNLHAEYFVIQFQAAKKKGKTSESSVKDFIFVGIHARGTDHIKYELDRGFVPLKTGVNFINILHMHFLYNRLFGSFFLVTFGLAPKFCMKNVHV